MIDSPFCSETIQAEAIIFLQMYYSTAAPPNACSRKSITFNHIYDGLFYLIKLLCDMYSLSIEELENKMFILFEIDYTKISCFVCCSSMSFKTMNHVLVLNGHQCKDPFKDNVDYGSTILCLVVLRTTNFAFTKYIYNTS